MKIRIAAGAAVLHAASTISVPTIVSREGALLAFNFGDCDEAEHLASLERLDATLSDAILNEDNEALIAGLTDLKRTLPEVEREVRGHFQVRDATTTEPTVTDTGSQPTSTGDAAISIAPQQSSEAVMTEEIDIEPSQQAPAEPRRRRHQR
ncbi:MAG TPA: hypothetical protein H9899_07310 [Candidatus Sphingomonas excrementigallinarum]|nr:hypothetical protein [Candidatus Sphingomonas excrementigallinarum]